MITVEGLTKTYGGYTAVDDVSFTARPGRVTGFLGPNGAGKTTTLMLALSGSDKTWREGQAIRRQFRKSRCLPAMIDRPQR